MQHSPFFRSGGGGRLLIQTPVILTGFHAQLLHDKIRINARISMNQEHVDRIPNKEIASCIPLGKHRIE